MKPCYNAYGLYYDDKYASIVPNTDWWQSERGKTWCANCTGLKRSSDPQPIDVYVERAALENRPIGVVSRHPMAIIRNDLRSMLKPWLDRFVFGRCFDDDGRLIVTHSTFYSVDYVVDRFGPGSTYKQCSECGLIWPKEGNLPRYFVEYEFRNQEIVQTDVCSTLISKAVLDTLDVRAVSGLDVAEYPVLERPIDGVRFPADPPDVEGDPPEPWSDRYSERKKRADGPRR